MSVPVCTLLGPRASRAKSSKVKRRLAAGQAPNRQPLAARGVTSHCTRRIVSSIPGAKSSPSTYLPIHPYLPLMSRH